MLLFDTLRRKEDGVFVVDTDRKSYKTIEPLFPIDVWDSPEIFKSANIRGYEPMTAKELETEEQQDEKFGDPNCYIEEKFDGTRALVYFLAQEDVNGKDIGYCRVFSRRVSKKTGFYVENSDSVPQIREINVPELAGTILDGEMFINGRPFKDVSSTLNCLWDKALDRQIEKDFISLHAFDILFYKGVDLRRMSLERRKYYLSLAIEEADSPYIEEVKCYECGPMLPITIGEALHKRLPNVSIDDFKEYIYESGDIYPELYTNVGSVLFEENYLTPRAYYELIVATGGEGVILKPKSGKYYHKRGWEYSKVKKFLTRDMIVIGFTEPTREYTGISIKTWSFWYNKKTNKKVMGNFYGNPDYEPITKNFYQGVVGNLILGVLIKKEDYDKLPKNKQGVIHSAEKYDENSYLMEVCECSGFDDETRDSFTKNQKRMIEDNVVVEVKANEIMKDSGRLRHPRFLRLRFDKEPERCTWEDHINKESVL